MSQCLLSPTAALCLPVAGLGQRMDHLHSLAVFHNCPSDLEILGAVLSQLLRSQSAWGLCSHEPLISYLSVFNTSRWWSFSLYPTAMRASRPGRSRRGPRACSLASSLETRQLRRPHQSRVFSLSREVGEKVGRSTYFRKGTGPHLGKQLLAPRHKSLDSCLPGLKLRF